MSNLDSNQRLQKTREQKASLIEHENRNQSKPALEPSLPVGASTLIGLKPTLNTSGNGGAGTTILGQPSTPTIVGDPFAAYQTPKSASEIRPSSRIAEAPQPPSPETTPATNNQLKTAQQRLIPDISINLAANRDGDIPQPPSTEVVKEAEEQIKKNPGRWKQLLGAGWTAAKIAGAVALGAAAVGAFGVIGIPGLTVGALTVGSTATSAAFAVGSSLLAKGALAIGAYGLAKSATIDINNNVKSFINNVNSPRETAVPKGGETIAETKYIRVGERENQELRAEAERLRLENQQIMQQMQELMEQVKDLTEQINNPSKGGDSQVIDIDADEVSQDEQEEDTANNQTDPNSKEYKDFLDELDRLENPQADKNDPIDELFDYKQTDTFDSTLTEAIDKRSRVVGDEEFEKTLEDNKTLLESNLPDLNEGDTAEQKLEIILTLGNMNQEYKIQKDNKVLALAERVKNDPKFEALIDDLQSDDNKTNDLIKEGLPIYLAILERQDKIDEANKTTQEWGGDDQQWQLVEAVLQNNAKSDEEISKWIKANMEPELSSWGVADDYKNATGKDFNLETVLNEIANDRSDCPGLIRQQLGKIMSIKLEMGIIKDQK